MMVPKKSLFLAGAALVCLGAVPTAQKSGKASLRRVAQPLQPVTLNLETGTITRGPNIQKSAVTTSNALNNNDRSGFVGVDTGAGVGAGPCEWIAPANKSLGSRAGGATGMMANFAFAYCSASLDPNSGGNGGSVIIGFREGYTYGTNSAPGTAPTGTDLGTFLLTGLPANTNCSSFFGGFSCFLITITFGNTPLCFGGDGIGLTEPNLAWSFQFTEVGTDGALAKTFPFLSCVASCSQGPGGVAGSGLVDGAGMENRVDQYCPAGTLLASFTFGSVNATNQGLAGFTSIDMGSLEVNINTSGPSTVTVITGQNNEGQGPAGMAETARPTLGGQFGFTINCAGATPSLAIFRISLVSTPEGPSKWGGIGVPIAAGTGFNFFVPHAGGLTTLNNVFGITTIPKQISFACFPLAVQGFCGDTGTGFTSNVLTTSIQALALK